MYFGVKKENKNPTRAKNKNKSCLKNGFEATEVLWYEILFNAISPNPLKKRAENKIFHGASYTLDFFILIILIQNYYPRLIYLKLFLPWELR